MAARIAEKGGTPVIADVDESRVRQVADELGLGEGCSIALDVGDAAACDQAIDEVVGRHGRIDGVVCCAAVFSYGGVADLTAEALGQTMRVNVNGSLFPCQAAARRMVASGRGGSMVLFSTGAAHRANGSPAYSASKAAVEVLVREMALAWADQGIRVNAVAPGPVETEMSRVAREDPEITAALMAHVPLRRFAQPEEMAAVADFLLSDGASFMTGTIVPADGGYLAL
jgi:NAD(P)-dependent dehydrogenase (short-subunit alcohol dehydrogenase family)